jgi:hypothetical protein
MIWPPEYYDCYVMSNDDIEKIIKQLESSNIFNCPITPPASKSTPLCCFKARVYIPLGKPGIEYYWLTNDERRKLFKRLKDSLPR